MDDLETELETDENSSDDIFLKPKRKPKPPLVNPVFVGTRNENGFRQSTRMCLERMREALLHHRWQEAAEYMPCFTQVLEDTSHRTAQSYKEIIWKFSTEILHHHPKTNLDDYNTVYELMKHTGFKNYLTISLEHAFHLMVNGRLDDAKRKLSAAESWRYGKESGVQLQQTKLVQAYRSLLDYFIWSTKRVTYCNTDDPDSHDNQNIHTYFRQASVNLKEILKCPGVWDPFILSYVEMLEFYDDQEEALKVLTHYANDKSFPPNPNAQVYLYQFLKRHDAPEKKLMKVLKVLHVKVPSHELMLEYISLLLQTEKQTDLQKALGVTLEMLDFSCWRTNLDVWKLLNAVIKQLQLQEDWKDVISEKMAERKGWWPVLHFTSFHASEDCEKNPELMEVKASLMTILCPDITLKYAAAQTANEERT